MTRKLSPSSILGDRLLILGSTLFALLVAEAVLRWRFPQMTYSTLSTLVSEQYRDGDFIPFTLKRDYQATALSMEYEGQQVPVSTNRWGMRGHDFEEVKPKDVRRILFLGDSYTFGVHVGNEEIFPA